MSAMKLFKSNYLIPGERMLSHQYVNEYNYFHKNNVKMSIWRQNKLNEMIKEKREKQKQYHLPKMLYSNVFLGNIAEHNEKDIFSDFLNPDIKFDKSAVETAAQIKQSVESVNQSHVKKQVNIFEDLLDCVDTLEIKTEDNLENMETDKVNEDKLQKDNNNDKNIIETTENENNNMTTCNKTENNQIIEDKQISVTEPTETNKNDNQLVFITKPNYKQPILPPISEDGTNPNPSVKNENKKNLQISCVTELTDDSLVNKLRPKAGRFKSPIQVGGYGKYRFSERGVHYPKSGPECDETNSREIAYFNYRNTINNPNKIYNSIGSFSEKFNKELGRISRSYGKVESKGRFVTNPLLNSYQEQIPFYNLYKDIKFIENRYADKKRYKFKLLPLVNAKLRNFDRLGERIYQQNLSKKFKNTFSLGNFKNTK